MNSLKEAFSRKNMLKNLNFFGELNLGLILTAVGIVYFKNPHHFAFGGTSGLSILLADLFPRINVGGFMWIINLILVVLGFVFLGIKTMGWTIYSSFALSFFVSVCEWLYPVNVSMSGDAMLDLVFAVFLPALGAAIVFDIGASTGGTDIVAAVLNKFHNISLGKALILIDVCIISSCLFLDSFGTIDLRCRKVVFGLCTMVIECLMLDYVMYWQRQSVQFLIFSKKYQEIAYEITRVTDHTLTILDGHGYYTGKPTKVICLLAKKRESLLIFRIVKTIDPNAFVSQSSVIGVYGEGFDPIKVNIKKENKK